MRRIIIVITNAIWPSIASTCHDQSAIIISKVYNILFILRKSTTSPPTAINNIGVFISGIDNAIVSIAYIFITNINWHKSRVPANTGNSQPIIGDPSCTACYQCTVITALIRIIGIIYKIPTNKIIDFSITIIINSIFIIRIKNPT